MRRNKIDRAKVLSALNTVCPSCGFLIPPAEVVRVDMQRMVCPKWGAVFDAKPEPVRKLSRIAVNLPQD
jgi:ribosomal protein S27AE